MSTSPTPKLDRLFAPGRIGGLELKNRIVMAAMGTGYCHYDGYVLDEYIAFMEERAKGGTGLLMTGVTRILSEVGMRPGSMGIYDDKLIPGLKKLTDVVHKHDAKIFMQLHHSGTRTSEETRAVIPSAPSAIVRSKCGMPPTTSTPRSSARFRLSSAPGLRSTPSCGKATSCSSR